jgi:hypothetical protein
MNLKLCFTLSVDFPYKFIFIIVFLFFGSTKTIDSFAVKKKFLFELYLILEIFLLSNFIPKKQNYVEILFLMIT